MRKITKKQFKKLLDSSKLLCFYDYFDIECFLYTKISNCLKHPVQFECFLQKELKEQSTIYYIFLQNHTIYCQEDALFKGKPNIKNIKKEQIFAKLIL